MDPVSVFGVVDSAIGALSACYKIYERIRGADEKIDHAGEEIELNLSFLKEYFEFRRAELSPEAFKRVKIRLENIRVAAEEARDILNLWEDYSKRWQRTVFSIGKYPGVLQDLSDKIEKNMVNLQTEHWELKLARGMTVPNHHTETTPVEEAPPSAPTGILPSGGFQPTLPIPIPNHPPQTLSHNQEQRPGSACLVPEPTAPSRPSELRTTSGNFNDPGSLLSSSAPPSTSASGGVTINAHTVTINNNQQPVASYSRPPLHHSSTAHPLIPFYQQQNAPLQNTLSPGSQHQRVGDVSSYSQPSAQLSVPHLRPLQPNNTNPSYSSENVNGVVAAQIPPSYGMSVLSAPLADLAAARPPASQPPRGTSHHPPNIPAQPQNYQNQPPRHQPHLSQTQTQPSRQTKASGWTGQGVPVPPATKPPQGSQTVYYMQIPHKAQPRSGFGQPSNQPQAPRTGHVRTPAATKQLQSLQQTHLQIPNNAQSGGGFLQPSNQPQAPWTRQMPASPTSSRPQGLQTTQSSNNGQLGGGSVQRAIQPQAPYGMGQIPAVSARQQGPQNSLSSIQNMLAGGCTQPARQLRAPCRTGQMPVASAPKPIHIPQQNQFPNKAPLRAGLTHPQTSHTLPSSGFAGIPQHHSGAPTYFPGSMSGNLNTSAQSSRATQVQQIPTSSNRNIHQAPGTLPLAVVGGIGVQHWNSSSGVHGNSLQSGFL